MNLRSAPQNKTIVLPTDSAERKKWCIYSGVVSPFPNALALIARLSYEGNLKHCEGSDEINWAMDKSSDHLDCLMRHTFETEWVHTGWRALANLETKAQAGYNPFVDNYFERNINKETEPVL